MCSEHAEIREQMEARVRIVENGHVYKVQEFRNNIWEDSIGFPSREELEDAEFLRKIVVNGLVNKELSKLGRFETVKSTEVKEEEPKKRVDSVIIVNTPEFFIGALFGFIMGLLFVGLLHSSCVV